jgi:hypothetical protein
MNDSGSGNNETDNGTNQGHSGAFTQVDKRTENHRKCADNNAKNANQTLLGFILLGQINREFVRFCIGTVEIGQKWNHGKLIVTGK